MRPVFVFDHPLFGEHNTGIGHPECAERLDAIVRGINNRGLTKRLGWPVPSKVDEKHLLRVHTESHIREMLGLRGRTYNIDADTHLSPSSIDAALTATGAALGAVDLVLENPEASAFCLGRPPGHHAERDVAMGFCVFNHVAAAADYAIAEKGVKRVLIFDPDVHHGNGTQDIFYRRGDVCYISVHQWPLFPGTDLAGETGEGEGEGTTVNLPLPAGMGDVEYQFVVQEIVLPLIRSFDPGLVIFSAGFDAHELDPLGGMRLTSKGFVGFYASIIDELFVRKTPSIFCLEGGYSLEALEEVVPMILEMLLEGPGSGANALDNEPNLAVQAAVAKIRRTVAYAGGQ